MDFEEQDEEMEEIAGSYDSLAAAKSAAMAESGGGGRYRECLKNHAVGMGGHAVDGCGEFLAAGPEGTLEALKCAACACHRNFHRREAGQLWPYYRTAAGYLQVRPLALAAAVEREEGAGPSKNKRFRTKFTAEQKERMLGLAERLGWRIQKQDESIVQEFCSDTGLRRHVLKVWMHNNKHTLGKKP